jgi:hypothetical protein
MPTLLRLFQKKVEAVRTLSNRFYKASITLIPKKIEDITRKENYNPISL